MIKPRLSDVSVFADKPKVIPKPKTKYQIQQSINFNLNLIGLLLIIIGILILYYRYKYKELKQQERTRKLIELNQLIQQQIKEQEIIDEVLSTK